LKQFPWLSNLFQLVIFIIVLLGLTKTLGCSISQDGTSNEENWIHDPNPQSGEIKFKLK